MYSMTKRHKLTVVLLGLWFLLGGIAGHVFTGATSHVALAADDWDDFDDSGGGEDEEGGLISVEEVSTEEVSKRLKELLSERDKVRYEPTIKRDPFKSLIELKPVGPQGEGTRPAGFAGRNVSELRLSGTWLGDPNTGRIAFLLDPKGRSFMQKVGDRCYNGKIIEVAENKVVFEEYQFGAGGKPRPPKIVSLFINKGKKLQ